jgi:hypothetical protein
VALITAVITHLDPRRVANLLDYLHALSPESRFVVCHGGSREDFEALPYDHALYIHDPSLRGPTREQSYTEIVRRVYESYVRDDSTVELVYFIEYDHLILSPRFEEDLEALAGRSGAGLFAKCVSPRNDSNCPHFARTRRDDRLNRFFAEVSCRDDSAVRWGCLGTGMLFRRDALEAVATVEDPAHGYMEIFIPSLVHHLGFELVDVDALSDLYVGVRWRPGFSLHEAQAAKRAGRSFLHPFKSIEGLDRILAEPDGTPSFTAGIPRKPAGAFEGNREQSPASSSPCLRQTLMTDGRSWHPRTSGRG